MFYFFSKIVRGPNETDQHHQGIVFAKTHMRVDRVHQQRFVDRVGEIFADVDKVTQNNAVTQSQLGETFGYQN